METPKVRHIGRGTTGGSESFTKSIRRLRGLNWQSKLLRLPQVPLLFPLNPWNRWRLMVALRSELFSSLRSCGLTGRDYSGVNPKFLCNEVW